MMKDQKLNFWIMFGFDVEIGLQRDGQTQTVLSCNSWNVPFCTGSSNTGDEFGPNIGTWVTAWSMVDSHIPVSVQRQIRIWQRLIERLAKGLKPLLRQLNSEAS